MSDLSGFQDGLLLGLMPIFDRLVKRAYKNWLKKTGYEDKEQLVDRIILACCFGVVAIWFLF